MTVAEAPASAGTVRRPRPEPERRTVERRTQAGASLGAVVLEPEVFGIEPNTAVLHQVVTAQLAAARAGTQSTRTRAQVSGGGAKPFRQKGSGRSRQGSTRSPQWTGGGVALGPKPRSYRQRTPKKMIRLALCSALSDRAADGRVALVDAWVFDAPRTKDAVAALSALGLDGRVLVVLGADDHDAGRSFANLPSVQLLPVEELNAYDVLRNDWVVFTDATVPGGVGEMVSGPSRSVDAEPVEVEETGPPAVADAGEPEAAGEIPAVEASAPEEDEDLAGGDDEGSGQ